MNSFKSKILIFAIIFVPITISLGFWQIDRAEEKKQIIASYDKLLTSEPVGLKSNTTYKIHDIESHDEVSRTKTNPNELTLSNLLKNL